MKRFAVAALALLAFVPSAGAGGPAPLSAVEWRRGGGLTLMKIDATSLAPIAGTRVDLGFASDVLARSPNGRHLFASGGNAVQVIDLKTRKRTRPYSAAAWLSEALWTRPDTVVGVSEEELVLFDPEGPRVRRRVDLGGAVLGVQKVGARVVLLIAPTDGIGPLRVALADGNGRVRSTPIPMGGGRRTLRDEERNPVGMYEEAPGLAVDASGKRAVVAGRTSVVEVDLATLDTAAHELAVRTTQKSIEGWSRQALWLDRDHVAVAGADYEAERSPTPAPVRIVDVRDWSAVEVDAKTSYVVAWRTMLLAAGDSLRAYDTSGKLVHTLLAERFRGQVIPGETWLYVETSGRGTSWRVLDWNGRVMGTRTFARPTNIVEIR